jgi:hypothetical protein
MNGIKVIKKEDAPRLKVKKRKLARPRDKARDMVATVSDWVTDFKERKSVETSAAFDVLRGLDTRPSEG